MALREPITRFGGSSAPLQPNSIYLGIVTAVYANNRPKVKVSALGATVGPCRMLDGVTVERGSQVACVFLSGRLEDVVVIGSLGVPQEVALPPGSNGERLIIDTSTESGYDWVPDSSNSLVDAKGDILAGSATDTLSRLPVGANNQLLVADSTQSTGLKWSQIGAIPLDVDTISISRSLSTADSGKFLRVTSTTVTVTIPLESSENFSIGTQVHIMQDSAGPVTIAGAVGVTVKNTPGLKLRTQNSVATLMKIASDMWSVFGDLTP